MFFANRRSFPSLWFLCCVVTAPVLADDMSGNETDRYRAYIVSPIDGARVSSPVTIIFGLKSPLGVAPAGLQKDNTGHHHLIIDSELPDLTEPIPNDDHHRHFGGGQTEVTLELEPGEHTLQLLLGDFLHRPHDPPIMSKRISITVE